MNTSLTAPDGPVRGLLDSLLSWQEPPPPFTAGSHPLWTDQHISRGMLAMHLDPQEEAASRRPEFIDASVAWLTSRLRPGARVLDLGCGPGLYAERLARAGFDVTGVDFSSRSVEYARSRGYTARFLLGDYREVALDETFDAVLLIYLDFGTFSPADARTILGRVRRWLAPGGVFVFDVPTAAYRHGRERTRDWSVHRDGFWADEPYTVLSRTLPYPDGPTYLDEFVIVTAGDVRLYRVWERCFTEATLRAELAGAGLAVKALHGDVAGAPFVPGTSTVIGAVATAA